jgi:hypothetical protein
VFGRRLDGQGEIQEICGEARVADTFAGDEVEMVTETVAGRALSGAEGVEKGRAVKVLCLNGNDGADDVGAVGEDHSVLGQGIDKVHGRTIYTPKDSQGRQIQCQQNLGDELRWEQFQVARGMLRLAVMPSVVKRALSLEGGLVQAVFHVS